MDFPKDDNNKNLRKFLESLRGDGTIEEDYTDSPIYKLGHEDGFNEAEELFNDKMRNIRRTLKTLLTHC